MTVATRAVGIIMDHTLFSSADAVITTHTALVCQVLHPHLRRVLPISRVVGRLEALASLPTRASRGVVLALGAALGLVDETYFHAAAPQL